MKICIFGAGAIGGFLGVQLSRAGADVSLVARGAHLAAIRSHGLRLRIEDEERIARLPCTDDPAAFGVQDCVIIALKAHDITGAVDGVKRVLGPETWLVTASNGLPYWYFHGTSGPLRDAKLESIDPGGRQLREFGLDRALG